MYEGYKNVYDFVARSNAARLFCDDPSRTVQSDAVDADINVIVRRFGVTGQMPQGLRLPEYGDYEGVFDFQSAQNALVQARMEFMRIPAEVRAFFDNDPQAFLEYASNPENIDGLRDLGLATALPVRDNAPAPDGPAKGAS